MDSLSPSDKDKNPSIEGPALDILVYKKQAQIAIKNHNLEEAIRIYKVALQKFPQDTSINMQLAKSYEMMAKTFGSNSFYLLAMEIYRQVILIDPKRSEAHDALLSHSVKTEQLGELLDEYKNRLTKIPNDTISHAMIKKIEALLLLQTEPQKKKSPPRKMTKVVMEIGMPFLGILCIGGSVFTGLGNPSPNKLIFKTILIRCGIFFLLIYFLYKIISYYRESN